MKQMDIDTHIDPEGTCCYLGKQISKHDQIREENFEHYWLACPGNTLATFNAWVAYRARLRGQIMIIRLLVLCSCWLSMP